MSLGLGTPAPAFHLGHPLVSREHQLSQALGIPVAGLGSERTFTREVQKWHSCL